MDTLPSADANQNLARRERPSPPAFVSAGRVAADARPAGPLYPTALEYYWMLRRNKRLLFLAALLGALAGLAVTLPQTPVYQSRATIEVQGVNEDFLNQREINPIAAPPARDPIFDIQTQVRLMQSRSLLARVIARLAVESGSRTLYQPRISIWRKALGLPPAQMRMGESTIRAVSANLKVRAQPNTRLVEISCEAPDAWLAAAFINHLAAELIEVNLEARWQSTQHTGEWLTRQMQDLRLGLQKSEEELQKYASVSGLIFTAEKDNVAEQKLKRLQEELSSAQAERISRQSRYELASRSSPESLAEVLDEGSLKELNLKLTDLRRELAELTSTLAPLNPKVKKVQAQVATLEAALLHERGNIVRRIQNDFDSAQRREKLLAADYGAQARLMAAQAEKVSHYNTLVREVNMNRQIYDTLLQRVKEAAIASALRASNIRVVDPADPPRLPFKPSPVFNAGVGGCAGILAGAVLMLFRERSDRTIQEPGDAATHAGIPELGLVPRAPARSGGIWPRYRSLPDAARSVELVTVERKGSAIAESFRTTLASIMFSARSGSAVRVFLVTSPAPNEGKTTVAMNLSIALAQARRRVLLIDADLRKPRLHTLFGLDNITGLADFLSGSQPVPPVLAGHVRPSGIPNLSVLTSGSVPEADPTLIYSDRLAPILNLAREQFDAIVIDTPPALPVADARIVAQQADAVVLVARAHRTSRDSLRDVWQQFAADGTLVMGAVLNDWDPRQSSRGDHYRYRQPNSESTA